MRTYRGIWSRLEKKKWLAWRVSSCACKLEAVVGHTPRTLQILFISVSFQYLIGELFHNSPSITREEEAAQLSSAGGWSTHTPDTHTCTHVNSTHTFSRFHYLSTLPLFSFQSLALSRFHYLFLPLSLPLTQTHGCISTHIHKLIENF